MVSCYAGSESPLWAVVTGWDENGEPLFTATCEAHLVALLDHKAQSNTVVSLFRGGDVMPPVEANVAPDQDLPEVPVEDSSA